MLYIADENDNGIRIDVRLSEILDKVSRSKIQSQIKSGEIKVNNEIKKPSYVLKDEDEVLIEETFFSQQRLVAQDTPLEIVYEDENMAVINKPSGMLTHPTGRETKNTLVNALIYKFKDNLSDINGDYRRGIVHRLDRNTSGLLMIAKNNQTHEYLANAIKNHCVEKKYRTIVKGIWDEKTTIIDAPIGRNPKQPHKMAVLPQGKESKTLVKIIKTYKDATALEVTLVTGRTHQIRVHLSYMRHPVYNDTLYGAGSGKVKTEEQVLQSFSLRFTKPFSDEIISLEIPPDEKYNKVLRYLEDRVK